MDARGASAFTRVFERFCQRMTSGIPRLPPLREARTMAPFELGLVYRAPPGAPLTQSNASDERSRDGRAAAVRYVQIKEAMMATGTVKWFNPTKGYGFIAPQDGGRDVFVHISAVERAGLSSLNEGQVIDYEVVSNRGKEAAENLKTR